MFPLGTPCLPGEFLPLRVFESRYMVMLEHLLAVSEPQFGVVMIDRGSEVGGGEVRRSVGSRVSLVRVEPQDSGHFAVLGIASERIRVVEWLEDAPYPQAIVETWHEKSADWNVDPSMFPRLNVLSESSSLAHVPSDQRIYAIAAAIGTGSLDRQKILEAHEPFDRMKIMEDVLQHLEEVARFSLGE